MRPRLLLTQKEWVDFPRNQSEDIYRNVIMVQGYDEVCLHYETPGNKVVADYYIIRDCVGPERIKGAVHSPGF